MYVSIYYLACAFVTGEENRRQIHNGLNQVRESNKPESVKLFIGPDGTIVLVVFIPHGSVDNSNETEIEVDDQNNEDVGGVHQQRHRESFHEKVC